MTPTQADLIRRIEELTAHYERLTAYYRAKLGYIEARRFAGQLLRHYDEETRPLDAVDTACLQATLDRVRATSNAVERAAHTLQTNRLLLQAP